VRYQLIGKNNLLAPIETVLRNRGIEDIQSFLHTSEKDVIHWSKLKNIDKAADCLLDHIKKESSIFIQVDADPDGYTSSATLINYLTKVFPKINIQWRLHEGKEHGVIVDKVPDGVNLVIIPDAGSNQFEEHKQLRERNIDIIVLDHHECSEESEDAIVVNSQLSPEYPNKQFSGVGIAYKFCKALDDKLGVKHADEYLDLVAIGNVADSQDMRSLETRYFVLKGLKNLKNKFIKALFDKQSFSTKDIVNITTTGFYINPLINACIRVGNMDEKMQMFRAFLGSSEQIYYKKKSVDEPIEVNTARLLGNLKAKQDRIRNKAIEDINLKIENKNLLNNKLLIVDITDILHKNLTGVVANKCAEKYKRPAMLLRFSEDEEFLTGSIRGYEKGYVKDFKTLLQKTGRFVFVEGHANAAGFKITPQNIVEVNEMINEQMKDIEVDIDLYEVDFIVSAKQLKKQFITEIDKHKDLWGQNVDEPLIAVKDIEVNKDEIYLNGKTSKSIKFIYNGIEYIKFFSNESEWESIVSQGERLVIDVIGKCSVNEYKGERKPQIKIEDYEVTKVKKKELVF
jgi:single-stranded-DNA-specific exonuclease